MYIDDTICRCPQCEAPDLGDDDYPREPDDLDSNVSFEEWLARTVEPAVETYSGEADVDLDVWLARTVEG